FTGLSPHRFGKLITVLPREGAELVRKGRPLELALEDRVLLVAAYSRAGTNSPKRNVSTRSSPEGREVSMRARRALLIGVGVVLDGGDVAVTVHFDGWEHVRFSSSGNHVRFDGPMPEGTATLNWGSFWGFSDPDL